MITRWTFAATSVTFMAAFAGLLSLAVSSCGGEDLSGSEVYKCPTKSSFTGVPAAGGAGIPAVSAYMERRCGTLDCHGAASIPMRLYGGLGRRHPTEGNIPGGVATTLAELEANYGAICSIEPERTAAQVVDRGQSAEELLVVRKARGIEGHKGGKIVNQGDSADKCIVGWLRGQELDVIAPDCQAAIDQLD